MMHGFWPSRWPYDTFFRMFFGLRGQLAVELQFRHVVDDAEQLPLCVDLGLATQRESAQAALLDMAKHRLDKAHAVSVHRAAFGAVDLLAHRAAVRVGQFARHGAFKEGDLAYRGAIGFAQALAAQRARFAGGWRAFENGGLAPVDDGVGAIEVKGLSRGAHAGTLLAIEGEVPGLEKLCMCPPATSSPNPG